jgi:two-component system sensor histidine kinase NblS
VSLTTQNRLIISGLILSTVLIVAIAFFATFNIQKKLNSGYGSFGQILSKTLAISTVEIIKDLPENEVYSTVKLHTDAILRGHNEIVLIEYRDSSGKLIYRSGAGSKAGKAVITVSSPMILNADNIGSVTVGLSGNLINQISSTTRGSLLFVFSIAWFVFAFVILINTYLITRELRILHEGVHKISTGEFGYKIEGKDVSSEVRELFDSFNDMSNRLHIYGEQNIEQLTLERNKMEAVLMSIANGVVVCDNFDNVVLVNEHARHLLDISETHLPEIKIQQYSDSSGNFCFKDKIEEFKDTPLSLMENKPLEFNIEIDSLTIKSIISPMFTRNKDYVGYIIVLIDMTKEAEMDKIRSHFISNVSHELRTPVTVLRSYIDTLYNYGNDFEEETKQEFIGIINNEVIRLNSMVNDILDFSRLDSDIKLEKSANSIVQAVESSVKQLQILAKERNLTILVNKDSEVPDAVFNYDAIERAFTNILSNAIKYSPDNAEIQVRIDYIRGTDEIEVSVKDYGCGIAPEHQKRIFERFYRVENNTLSVKGTGLGLHLVKTTIEKYHQGSVFVHSEAGQGSTFGFRLPAGIVLASFGVGEV